MAHLPSSCHSHQLLGTHPPSFPLCSSPTQPNSGVSCCPQGPKIVSPAPQRQLTSQQPPHVLQKPLTSTLPPRSPLARDGTGLTLICRAGRQRLGCSSSSRGKGWGAPPVRGAEVGMLPHFGGREGTGRRSSSGGADGRRTGPRRRFPPAGVGRCHGKQKGPGDGEGRRSPTRAEGTGGPVCSRGARASGLRPPAAAGEGAGGERGTGGSGAGGERAGRAGEGRRERGLDGYSRLWYATCRPCFHRPRAASARPGRGAAREAAGRGNCPLPGGGMLGVEGGLGWSRGGRVLGELKRRGIPPSSRGCPGGEPPALLPPHPVAWGDGDLPLQASIYALPC